MTVGEIHFMTIQIKFYHRQSLVGGSSKNYQVPKDCQRIKFRDKLIDAENISRRSASPCPNPFCL
jgi:hypothetical protein